MKCGAVNIAAPASTLYNGETDVGKCGLVLYKGSDTAPLAAARRMKTRHWPTWACTPTSPPVPHLHRPVPAASFATVARAALRSYDRHILRPCRSGRHGVWRHGTRVQHDTVVHGIPVNRPAMESTRTHPPLELMRAYRAHPYLWPPQGEGGGRGYTLVY